MKFAFLVHPLTEETKNALSLDRGLKEVVGRDFVSWVQHLHRSVARMSLPRAASDGGRVAVVDELPELRSALGKTTHGRLYEIPMDAFAILENPNRALEYIEEAVNDAADWGARIVGLGSMTGVVGSQGQYIAEKAPVPVTTGNSLTVYAAVENLLHACRTSGLDLAEATFAILGVPGSIATAAARILAPQCRALLLVSRTRGKRALQIADELNAELLTEIPAALARATVIFSATSSGQCIDQQMLLPGSVVSDVAVPADVLGTSLERNDVLILTGGLSRVPPTMPFNSDYLWFHRGMIPSCLAETMVLGLEDDTECYSLGRDLDVAKIQQIGKTADAHGFAFNQFTSFGLRLDDAPLIQFRKLLARKTLVPRAAILGDRLLTEKPSRAHHAVKPCGGENGGPENRRRRKSATHPPGPAIASAPDSQSAAPCSAATPGELADEAAERWRRYVNPVLMSISGSGFIKTFVRGEGMRLWDANDRNYLDFVAGYGSVNLGHNHPRVVEAIRTALAEEAPGFSPAAVNPYAAALADELVTIAPPGLDMVSFANSGTEAVEAAIKLARAATGRPDILSCEGSYHGKSLGALSVTGNATYQRPFQPLLPGCRAIPYGDAAALRRALESQRYAAFIVEPMQGEGGMIVPPEGYLREVDSLCRQAGTLLMVDEVQTGLGRTGDLFAVDAAGVHPDVMTLAKSLSGGLVPCGAMLCRRELWIKAYGTIQTFALHTSTFAGGSLASAAALATIRELRRGAALANAAARGRQLLAGLREIAAECQVVKEVRGQGLLIGMELQPLPPAMCAHWKTVVSDGASTYLVPNLDAYLESIPALYVMNTLLDAYGIYTQVTRSNPRVLRIQPPLIISPSEVDYFLDSVRACCREADFSNRLFEVVISKSGIGQHDPREALRPPGLPSQSRPVG